jgi:hypothetical protein
MTHVARRNEYNFSDEVRQQLIQVVLGFTGRCDETAARRGMEWMRAHTEREARLRGSSKTETD